MKDPAAAAPLYCTLVTPLEIRMLRSCYAFCCCQLINQVVRKTRKQHQKAVQKMKRKSILAHSVPPCAILFLGLHFLRGGRNAEKEKGEVKVSPGG
jgi:hypothetical protein